LQGSGEESVFTSSEMQEMLELSRKGIEDLVGLQREAILAAGQSDGKSLPDLGSA
ncbi:MAG TPA: ribonuclease PH, partial [Verrucomicrobiales bacterium]|nr:ribonuclease PH [Verrucomicrobiales bacterium]